MKIIEFDTKKIREGVNLIADAVKVTLGARGMNVIIKRPFAPPHITKDGITVAKEIESDDPIINTGIEMVLEGIEKIGNEVGDGTTTVTVLIQELIENGMDYIDNNNISIVELKEGMFKALTDITKMIKEKAIPIELDSPKLKEIVKISANGDEEIAELVVNALQKAGIDGNVKVISANSTTSFISETKGIEIDKGYLSPYFVTDTKEMKVKYEDTLILFYDGKLDNVYYFSKIVNSVMQQKKSLLIIADEYSDEIMNLMVMNKMKTNIPIVAIKSPLLGDNRKEIMRDYAVLTGGSYVSSSTGLQLETITLNNLGQADSIEVSKTNTTIIGGRGAEDEIKIRIDEVKNSDINESFKKQRLNVLKGNTVLINVGAFTSTELEEKKDRIDDALHAAKASLEEGIVAGGGLTLARIGYALYNPKNEKYGGYELVVDSLFTPMYQIIENAGVDYLDTFDKLIDNITDEVGFDVKNMKFTNMFDAGIIDPAKVVRSTIETAVAIASMVLSTSVVIANEKQEEMNNDDINPYNFI